MSTPVKIVEDQVTTRLNRMLERLKGLKSYLDTVVYKQYQEAQVERWETEGASELKRKWTALSPIYRANKLRKFSGFPYAGKRIGIATGELAKSVIGSDRSYHRKLVTENQLVISSTLDYATDFNEERSFTKFSPEFKREVAKGITKFLKASLG